MTDREKLVEIIANARRAMWSEHMEGSSRLDKDRFFADQLLSHGVTIKEQGEWVMRGGKRYCSVCSQRACVTRDREDFWYTVGTDFCPHCGAPMKKVE